jgi:hypothetical protein
MKRKTAVQAGLLFVICAVMCSVMLNASNISKTATFKGTSDQVFNAAVKVAQLKWHVTFLDRETKTLSFHDFPTIGDVACSVVVDDSYGDLVLVTLGMQARSSDGRGVMALEVGEEIASQFFKGIEAELSRQAKLAKQPH